MLYILEWMPVCRTFIFLISNIHLVINEWYKYLKAQGKQNVFSMFNSQLMAKEIMKIFTGENIYGLYKGIYMQKNDNKKMK